MKAIAIFFGIIGLWVVMILASIFMPLFALFGYSVKLNIKKER